MRFLPIRFPALLVAGSLLWAGVAHAGADPVAMAALLQKGAVVTVAGRPVETAILQRIYAARSDRSIWNAERRAALLAALAEAPSHGLDPGAVLARAVTRGVAPTLAALAPQDARYMRLRQAYLRYRDYAQRTAWKPIALALPLMPGTSGPNVVKLRHRLAAEGLVPPGDSPAFDADLSVALGRFRSARGLPASGVVMLATLTALNIAPGARLRTIRLNLERWRAMPRDLPPTRIEVNVPGSQVILFEDGQPILTTRAVVGALENPTPVLQTRMVAVTFNPPRVVPSSIIAKETRPAMLKDPDYLKQHDYTYVDVPGGKQLIQRPGPQNTLSRIKFEMSNRFDIYLHNRSRQDLMDRSRRALNHGCIRLDNPRALARCLLASDSAWTLDAIDAAIAAGKTRTVPLPKPISVYVLYDTAFANAAGTVEFRNDIYDRDGRLDEALVARDLREQLHPAVAGGRQPQLMAAA